MGTFYANRTAYPIGAFDFDGLPKHAVDGDVAPDAPITMQMTILEDNLSDVRSYLQNAQGFAGRIVHNYYEFDFGAAKLTAPLPEHDWTHHLLQVNFRVTREFITRLIRPQGQPKRDPADVIAKQLWVVSQDEAHLRRKRLEYEHAMQEWEERRLSLVEAETALEARKAQIEAEKIRSAV
jgi:hypothetical protein